MQSGRRNPSKQSRLASAVIDAVPHRSASRMSLLGLRDRGAAVYVQWPRSKRPSRRFRLLTVSNPRSPEQSGGFFLERKTKGSGMTERDNDGSAFVLAYALAALSGFIVGALVGWMVRG